MLFSDNSSHTPDPSGLSVAMYLKSVSDHALGVFQAGHDVDPVQIALLRLPDDIQLKSLRKRVKVRCALWYVLTGLPHDSAQGKTNMTKRRGTSNRTKGRGTSDGAKGRGPNDGANGGELALTTPRGEVPVIGPRKEVPVMGPRGKVPVTGPRVEVQ